MAIRWIHLSPFLICGVETSGQLYVIICNLYQTLFQAFKIVFGFVNHHVA